MKLSISLTLLIFIVSTFLEVPVFSQKIHYPSCIPDSTKFYYKHITDESTINTDTFDKMNGLNNKQVQAWLNPFFHNSVVPSRSETYIKMVSFQKKTQEYYSFIIATIFETPEQYLITVSPKGKYIDGLEICYVQNRTNSDVQFDSINHNYILIREVKAILNGDTIIMKYDDQISDKKIPLDEDVLTYRISENDYMIDHSGRIILIQKNKKIDIDKLLKN